VRLENDILVTEQGPVDLMAHIPIEADEIEGLMNSRSKIAKAKPSTFGSNTRSDKSLVAKR